MEDSRDILLALGRLEGKVESIIAMQRSTSDNVKTLDRRIRILEQGKSWVLGVAAAVGAAISLVVTWLTKG